MLIGSFFPGRGRVAIFNLLNLKSIYGESSGMELA
jgi:hypothetical protein